MYINNHRNRSLSQPASPQIINSQVYSPMPFRTPVFNSSNKPITAFPWNELDNQPEEQPRKANKPNRLLLNRLQDLTLDDKEPRRYFS